MVFGPKQINLQRLLSDQNIDVLLLAETKVHSKKGIKLEGYQLFPVVRKNNIGGGGGGVLLIAVRNGVCTSLVVSEGENAEFLTVKLIFDSEKIRLILVYGPQEYSSESDKETFWHNNHVEVDGAKLAGKNLLLIGDFNAKLGRAFIPGDIHDISINGNQLLNLWESRRLCLLNIQKFAEWTFTWVNNNNVKEKSIIDYMFSNYAFLPNVVSFEIDEGTTLPLGGRKRRERHFLTIMQWLSNSKSAGSHIIM